MIGADTNLIARFIIGDVEDQTEKIAHLFDQQEQFYINEVVLTELTWVLTVSYRFTKQELVETYDFLLESSGFTFFSAEIIAKALAQFMESTVGFNDCLISEINKDKGYNTLTFDKKAAKLDGMELL